MPKWNRSKPARTRTWGNNLGGTIKELAKVVAHTRILLIELVELSSLAYVLYKLALRH